MRFDPVLDKLKPYHAGPSLAEITKRYQLDEVVRLSANEVPWGPFPEVRQALRAAVDELHRYPDGSCAGLRSQLASQLGVGEQNLCFGNGSCELLMLLGQIMLGPDRHAVLPHPSFVMYQVIALANGGPFTAVPLKGLDHDLEAMSAAIKGDTSLVFVCNPNNPTGGYVEPARLRRFLEGVPQSTLVVVDEAYGEFVTPTETERTESWVSDFPNLVVLHTFSKIYGLAGLRLGYAVADPEVVRALDKVRQPFNVDSLAQIAAEVSLRHPERVAERRELIAAERLRLTTELAALGVEVAPSQGNFLLVDVTDLKVPGESAGQELMARGILTRSGYAMDCPGWLRVTMGDPDQGDTFLAAMKQLKEVGAQTDARKMDTALDAESLSPES